MCAAGQRAAALCRDETIGSDLQITLTRRLYAFDSAGIGDTLQRVLTIQRCPICNFVITTNIALKVDTPGLHIAVAITQRRERNFHLGTPAVISDLRIDFPGGFPVEIESSTATTEATTRTLVGHLRIIFDAGRVGTKDESVLAIEQAIENHLKTVCLIER